MPRTPSTDVHAEQAVAQYLDLLNNARFGAERAWLAVAQVLMTTEVWSRREWHPCFGELVLLESNAYKINQNGEPNRSLKDAALIGKYISDELGIPRDTLAANVGLFFKLPEISPLQPNNLRGHAFRSIVSATIARFGDPEIQLSEEETVRDLFPGWDFGNRSDKGRLDIVARREGRLVALLSTRWALRHDRIDVIDEARAYVPAARNSNRRVRFYAVTAEMMTSRLHKVINESSPIHPNAAIHRLVHVKPELASTVIGRNGPLIHLFSLADLVRDSFEWN